MKLRESNGGFPEPPAGDPVRVVRAGHDACGADTRIRLSGYLPARAVRRVVCERCEESYECASVVEVDEAEAAPAPETIESAAIAPVPLGSGPSGTPVPTGSGPSGTVAAATEPATPSRQPRLPAGSPVWRWIGIPVAALAVVAALILLQGDDPEPSAPVTKSPAGATPAEGGGDTGEARFITQPGYSLALPPGWEQTPAEGGAAFTAAAVDEGADATLWIERAPDLTFAEFEARSLEQLTSLTGNAEVIERIPAPTDAGTVVRLRADTPEGSGVSAPYDVTLRATGPFRYYLATTVEPGASRQASEGADLIHGSFVPEQDGGGDVQTGGTPGSEDAP